MAIKVRNINGTSGRKPKDYSSWLQFWQAKSNDFALYCSCEGCFNTADVGAHVQEAGSDTSDKWYIVPLCYECNKKTKPFKISKNELVSLTEND